jgi:excisionase family DNA binding protein
LKEDQGSVGWIAGGEIGVADDVLPTGRPTATVTVSYVARRIGVDHNTVQRWCREGRLRDQVYRTPGRHFRIPRAVAESLFRIYLPQPPVGR